MIRSRSPIVHLGIRAASPLALVVGAYLLFAGHNRPGGGFAAGLVFGAVLTLRSVAGLQRPTHVSGLVASGMAVVAATAVAPVLWGDPLLDQKVISVELPLFGEVKSGSALVFDVGVALIVVGLVVALLNGLAEEDLTATTGNGNDVSRPKGVQDRHPGDSPTGDSATGERAESDPRPGEPTGDSHPGHVHQSEALR